MQVADTNYVISHEGTIQAISWNEMSDDSSIGIGFEIILSSFPGKMHCSFMAGATLF